MAQRISNASFATLSLIYSLTEILDLSDLLATLAGLTARVSVLMQVSISHICLPPSFCIGPGQTVLITALLLKEQTPDLKGHTC